MELLHYLKFKLTYLHIIKTNVGKYTQKIKFFVSFKSSDEQESKDLIQHGTDLKLNDSVWSGVVSNFQLEPQKQSRLCWLKKTLAEQMRRAVECFFLLFVFLSKTRQGIHAN